MTALLAFLAFFGTVLGAFLGSIVNEKYKRHRDAISTAAAICGEIASYRGAWQELRLSLPILIGRVQSGTPLDIPDYGPQTDVAFEKYVDKIGLLGARRAEEISFIYGKIRSFRAAIRSISAGQPSTTPSYRTAALQIANENARIANAMATKLVPDLREFARRAFTHDLFSLSSNGEGDD